MSTSLSRFWKPLIAVAVWCMAQGIAVGQTQDGSNSTNDPNKSGLGDGLNFSLNEGDYQFRIGGFLQPSWQYSKLDNQPRAENVFRSKRTYLNFGGRALKEKVSFFVQADFSAATPLLDAWLAYHVTPNWTISAGQRRTFTNNREMTFNEDQLQFADRSLTSNTFAGNGREFGLFVEGKIGTSLVLVPQLAITSGDGPNSFGVNSTDVDLGGFKYGGRLDIYLMGEFSEGNRGLSADLVHETKPKVLIGLAGSFNRGASNAKGEGHGDFLLYGDDKKTKLPDLRKFSVDVLAKYKGFSFLGEYINTSAANLAGVRLDTTGTISSILRPGQISQYLTLGNAISAQLGYVTKSGYALDLRYESLNPEFKDNTASILQQTEVSTLGLSKYFNGNKLKVQASVSNVRYGSGRSALNTELMMQVVL